MQFRSPPTSLIKCAKCSAELLVTQQDSSADVTTAEAGFKCPACSAKFSVAKIDIAALIKEQKKRIETAKKVLQELEAELKHLKELNNTANRNKCPVCKASWTVEETTSLVESGFKCPSCSTYNLVKKAS